MGGGGGVGEGGLGWSGVMPIWVRVGVKKPDMYMYNSFLHKLINLWGQIINYLSSLHLVILLDKDTQYKQTNILDKTAF